MQFQGSIINNGRTVGTHMSHLFANIQAWSLLTKLDIAFKCDLSQQLLVLQWFYKHLSFTTC